MNFAFFKPRRCSAEDEIRLAGDVTIFKILPPAIEQNCILPAEETAVAERGAVAVHADGERLADRCAGILERDVFRREIVRINCCRRRLERADGAALGVGDAGVKIEREDGVRRILATSLKKLFSRWM